MGKTKNHSVRFDEDNYSFACKREGIKSGQKLVDFLLNEYCKLYKAENKSVFDYKNHIEDIKNSDAFTDRIVLAKSVKIEPTLSFTEPIDKFTLHKNNITNSDSRQDLVNSVNNMKNDMFLNRKQKWELEDLAKGVMENKGFIYND
jgi:hypothetical protein